MHFEIPRLNKKKPQSASRPLPQYSALLLAWLKDGRLCSAQRNVHHQHLLQNKNERKTKCSDKKVAVGNEFLGNDAERTLQRGREAAKLAFLDRLKLRFRNNWRHHLIGIMPPNFIKVE